MHSFPAMALKLFYFLAQCIIYTELNVNISKVKMWQRVMQFKSKMLSSRYSWLADGLDILLRWKCFRSARDSL